MNIIPTILEKTNNECIAYDLYSRLLEDRIIFLSGEINDQLANLIISELLYLDSKNHDEIDLYINSPGGSVTAGMAIYDTMQYIKCDVSTVCIGMAASRSGGCPHHGRDPLRNAGRAGRGCGGVCHHAPRIAGLRRVLHASSQRRFDG